AAPGLLCRLLHLQQAGQPVADRAAVDPAGALIAEQGWAAAHPGPDLVEIPAQDQVEPVQHRPPPGPRPGRLRALAEPDVQLPERTTAEMNVAPVHHRRLVSP